MHFVIRSHSQRASGLIRHRDNCLVPSPWWQKAQKKEADVSMPAVSEQGAAKQDQDPKAQRAQLKKVASAKKAGDGENAV